jgi:hypothetical protein
MPLLWGHISFECYCLMNVHDLNNKFFGRNCDVQWVRELNFAVDFYAFRGQGAESERGKGKPSVCTRPRVS